jgi:hypothetical protein
MQNLVTPASQMKSLTQSSTSAPEVRRVYEEQYSEYKLNEFGQGEAKLAAFIDIDEDGRMDVLLQTESAKGTSSLICIYNNYVKDTFFVKALMVANTVGIYGDAASGASYRLIVTDLNDEKFVVMAS